jgi:diguanylate cyclase (GGDEF)-like protein
MLAPFFSVPITLDISTLFIVATCVTALLGIFLLFSSMQDRTRALAWWGAAYLVGGFSVAIWSVDSLIAPPLPSGMGNALIFVACGMIWNAARLFHGKRILWGAMLCGAIVWVAAALTPDFVQSAVARIVLSSLIVAAYTFLTAAELWSERRKSLIRRWPAIFVPVLHGMVFLFPIPLASLLPNDGGIVSLAGGWVAVFALETMLYIVGTAFIALVVSKEQTVRAHKDAALTDAMTGLFNRRGFDEAAAQLMVRQRACGEPVTVLMFDLDHFKAINDRFGHATGDAALRAFAETARANMRGGDILARFGGEEFVVMVPGTLADGATAAERVRMAFEVTGREVDGRPLAATVSVGAVSGEAGADVALMLARADAALYRAKANGRNRIALDEELLPAVSTTPVVTIPAMPQAAAGQATSPAPVRIISA